MSGTLFKKKISRSKKAGASVHISDMKRKRTHINPTIIRRRLNMNYRYLNYVKEDIKTPIASSVTKYIETKKSVYECEPRPSQAKCKTKGSEKHSL